MDPNGFFETFRAGFAGKDPIAALRAGLIGKDMEVDGPFGPKPMLYADYVASGRAIMQIEQAILEHVLPYYANSHTESSYCGAAITGLRQAARDEIARLCGATEDHAVIFAGSGATTGLNRLVHLLGVDTAVKSGRGATIIIGPYEHHSNILPWRESGARVIELPEADHGGPDLDALDQALAEATGLVIGSFSAASNVSGILTDVLAVTRRLKSAGALSVWDYAGGGPYLDIAMTPAPDAPIDAIALSPHKFVGGPGASGLLLIRRDAVASSVPTFPGGGTVRFVSSDVQDYSLDIAEREEAGTPNIVGDIRAALVLILKDIVGTATIAARDAEFATAMTREIASLPGVEMLGHHDAARLPIFSIVVSDAAGQPYHPQYITRLMSDCFGIQARGGCACAGPYGHQLLHIDRAMSDRLRQKILAGDLTEKPGFTRFSLNYLMSEAETARIATALAQLPALAEKHHAAYALDGHTGTFSAQECELPVPPQPPASPPPAA